MTNRKRLLASTLCLALLTFAPAAYAATGDDNGAAGQATSSVSGSGNTATSIGAQVTDSDHSVAVGSSAQVVTGSSNYVFNVGGLSVSGDGNTAIGTSAQVVNGVGLKAIGYGAVAGYGNYNTAIGTFAWAGGFSPSLRSDENVAVGSNTQATGGGSVAIGSGAQALAGGSVAIGAYSVAPEPNTVSVGQPGYERRITNVAPGVNGTDAVNMNQLMDTRSKVNRLGATAMAMSGLAPMGYNPKEPTQFSAAIGTYGGDTGFALGVYHYTSERVLLNAAVGISSDGFSREVAGRFGITWWGGGSKKDKPVSDNTVTGTNVPAMAPAASSQAPAKTGASKPAAASDNIVDRVNRLLQTSGEE